MIGYSSSSRFSSSSLLLCYTLAFLIWEDFVWLILSCVYFLVGSSLILLSSSSSCIISSCLASFFFSFWMRDWGFCFSANLLLIYWIFFDSCWGFWAFGAGSSILRAASSSFSSGSSSVSAYGFFFYCFYCFIYFSFFILLDSLVADLWGLCATGFFSAFWIACFFFSGFYLIGCDFCFFLTCFGWGSLSVSVVSCWSDCSKLVCELVSPSSASVSSFFGASLR